MTSKKYEQIAYNEANQSKCKIRQVGAVLVRESTGVIVGQGCNYSTTCACNDDSSVIGCAPDIVHAEESCLRNSNNVMSGCIYDMYITQPPCNECIEKIKAFSNTYNITINIYICEQFLKFDDDKLRFDLIPPEWAEEEAKVLTHGAKKYKPNNWRKADDLERFKGAILRHLNKYLQGELRAQDSGLLHLACLRVNVGFLMTIEEQYNENFISNSISDTFKNNAINRPNEVIEQYNDTKENNI